MVVALMMGFAAGLPLLLTISLLQAWMTQEGVDLTTIGLMALVGLPYTLKFLWAPVLDRFSITLFGRRRGWLLLCQMALMVAIIGLGATDPSANPWWVAAMALLVAFFSASQDVVIDAYRREDLADEELGLGSSLYISGYRLGMWVAGGGGFILADQLPFSMVYTIMACCLLPAVITTMLTSEPQVPEGTPKTMAQAVIAPFKDYFSRRDAIWILAFIVLYKIGDTMAGTMTTPFYLDIGFSMTQIGTIVKTFGAGAIIGGGLVGGVIMLRLGIRRSLWVFGFLQALSTAGFVVLAYLGDSVAGLTAVIAFENLSAGMGTAAYAAFMASITNQRFTATQYALLTSLMGIPRVIASSGTGFMAETMGWSAFFMCCTLIAAPGMLLLLKIAPWRSAGKAHVAQ
ncbi:MAG: AmpG family muropeptide MFS transporter [Desulfatitalea sp.]|nr:AmpG family muropeptide MFS transporter [Desulfatitalea sp.]NNJ99850.1 AmpG family muropeptide MFS transporter [Desulfatitalea sp.]